MPINLTTLVPASTKAKEVATEQYVNDTAVLPEDLGPTGTTVIDGGRIDTDSLFAQDITYTGSITGGTGGLGGIIKSSNYVDGTSGMKIDLVNGSIYIA